MVEYAAVGIDGVRLRTLLAGAKLAVSGGLIAWLLHDVDITEIAEAAGRSDPYLLGLAFSLFFVGYFITAARWRLLLRTHGNDAPLSRLVKSFMVAIFFNNFLPSTIGGDVVRVYDTWKMGTSRSVAFSVIFVDRFLGSFALSLIALSALLAADVIAERIPYLYVWVTMGVVGLGALAYLIFGNPRRNPVRLDAGGDSIGSAPIRVVRKLLAAFGSYRGRRATLAGALALSLVLHLNVIVHYVIIAKAMGLAVPWEAMFFVIPVATFVMMLPVSVNGIGVRETVFALLLGFYGVSAAQSIAFAWIAYGFVLAQGLLGGVVFASRRSVVAPDPDKA